MAEQSFMTVGFSPGERAPKIRLGPVRLSRRGLLAGSCYEGAVIGIATGGAVTHEPKYWIALLCLTLICGIAAFIGLYLGYGLLATLGTAVGAHMSANGHGPRWFVISDGIIDVALFAAAGAANVALLSLLAARASHRRAHRIGR
jgi:hypothetical protein